MIKLKEFRGKRSQNEVANELGLNRTTLSLLENGKQTPSLKLLQDFCNISNLNPNMFFNSKNEDKKEYMIPNELDLVDQESLIKVIERIEIKNKYLMLLGEYRE